ncbi:hypothetical protein OAS39_02165 [Pirellulales bacterium]|nr:hypothetical protein [Pirellulales bacterium]
MNTTNSNNIAFRLPADHLRKLDELAATRGQSTGKLAKEIVIAALMNFSRFDEMGHRLGVVERALEHLVERAEDTSAVQTGVDQLRASLATAVSRLLIETGRVDGAEAISWTEEIFNVRESQ